MTTDAVIVRDARSEDGGALQAFHRALYEDQPRRLVTRAQMRHYTLRGLTLAIDRHLADCLASPDTLTFVAVVGEAPRGYIMGYVEDDAARTIARVGVIESWYVTEGQRRCGVGRALMTALVGAFGSRGCEAVESSTYAANTDARQAHEALGFWPFDVRMRRDL